MLLLLSGLGNHDCEENEVSMFLRAGCTGEVVRWDGIEPPREKSREAWLDIFLMREKYLPS